MMSRVINKVQQSKKIWTFELQNQSLINGFSILLHEQHMDLNAATHGWQKQKKKQKLGPFPGRVPSLTPH